MELRAVRKALGDAAAVGVVRDPIVEVDPHRFYIAVRLEVQSALTGIEVLARQKKKGHLDRFTDNHPRNTQRMPKAWRALEAKKIIHSAKAALVLAHGDPMAAPEQRQSVSLLSSLG